MLNDVTQQHPNPGHADAGNGNLAPTPAAHPDNAASSSHIPLHYQPRTRTHVTVFAVVLSVALIVGFVLVWHSHNSAEAKLADDIQRSASEPVVVDVVRVQRAGTDQLLTLPGDARSFYETTIFARTSGYLSKWLVDIGDKVKEGQLMATIETPELDDQLHEATARVAQAEAEAHVAETSAKFAKISYDRWEAAAPEGVVSAQERDQKKSELDQSIAKLEASNSAVSLGQAQLQRLQTLEKFKNVVAPFEGVVTQRHIDIGALVTAGSTTNTTPLFTISQANQIRVFVDVPQMAAGDIRIGMHADVSVRELPTHPFQGMVDRTATSIDPRSRTLKVEVLVPNPDLALLPGMYVQTTFLTLRQNPPVQIPASALTFGPGGPEVAAVSADGTVQFMPIKIAHDLGNSIEVGSGLNEGQMVALNIGNQVVSGQKIEAHVVEEKSSAPPASGKMAMAEEKRQ